MHTCIIHAVCHVELLVSMAFVCVAGPSRASTSADAVSSVDEQVVSVGYSIYDYSMFYDR